MKRVVILRHAKSDWSDAALRDFDRELNERGLRAAQVMGQWAAREGMKLDAVIASPAKRVVETLKSFSAALGNCPPPQFDLRLYLASAASIADVIAGTDADVNRLLVAGHSPGLEEFILGAAGDDPDSALIEAIEEKFPTAAMAVLDFDIDDWTTLADAFEGRAHLRRFTRPRDLDPALGPER